MNKVKCTIAYDGSSFVGFQIQPNKRTIQGEIERALMKMHKGEMIRIHPSGRTDTGVHAVGQVFHFESNLAIPPANWQQALQTLLPDDIVVKEVVIVDAWFHARYDAIEKEYHYFVFNSGERDVFKRNYSYFSSKKYDMQAIQAACKVFEGTHDFTSFSSAKSTVKGSRVRTLYEVSCSRSGDIIQFVFRGNGFLQHMVRIIVNALLEVGEGKRTVQEIADILEKKDRTLAGMTIPPEGLYLWQVKYGGN